MRAEQVNRAFSVSRVFERTAEVRLNDIKYLFRINCPGVVSSMSRLPCPLTELLTEHAVDPIHSNYRGFPKLPLITKENYLLRHL